MTQEATARRTPPPTRRIIQGLGSLVLIVAIFYFLLKSWFHNVRDGLG